MNLDGKGFVAGFMVLWVLGVLLSLGTAGVVIWAIIRLVSKYG